MKCSNFDRPHLNVSNVNRIRSCHLKFRLTNEFLFGKIVPDNKFKAQINYIFKAQRIPTGHILDCSLPTTIIDHLLMSETAY